MQIGGQEIHITKNRRLKLQPLILNTALKGWDKTFKQAINNRPLIIDILRQKMDSQQLIIGTKSHRRAFASVDLHDLLDRTELGQRVMRLKETWENQ